MYIYVYISMYALVSADGKMEKRRCLIRLESFRLISGNARPELWENFRARTKSKAEAKAARNEPENRCAANTQQI